MKGPMARHPATRTSRDRKASTVRTITVPSMAPREWSRADEEQSLQAGYSIYTYNAEGYFVTRWLTPEHEGPSPWVDEPYPWEVDSQRALPAVS